MNQTNYLGKFINLRSLVPFTVSLVAAFLMVLIPRLHSSQNWSTPMPNRIDQMIQIRPKLEQKKNSFQLKKQIIPPVSASSEYDQAASYAVVNYETGEVIASKDLSKRLPIASLTKLMTAVVALDLAKADEKFMVSEVAASEQPTKVALQAGESYKLADLLDFALISSANDSAQVIKEGIDQKYGQEVFLEAMNEKAKALGLNDTHFTNPQGFDNPDHYSSAGDLALLAHYALENYPDIAQTVSKDVLDLTNGWADRRFYLQNWNGLLDVYPGVKGVKIGNTELAGNCTIVLSERAGKKVLVIVLGAPGVLQRDLWAGQLLDIGFDKLANLDPVNVTEAQLKQKYSSWKYFTN